MNGGADLPKAVRTLVRVAGMDADGNFLVEWSLACPCCGSAEVEALEDQGSRGLLRCENGHLSTVALVADSRERLMAEVA